MRLLFVAWALGLASQARGEDRLDFAGAVGNRVASDEQVVEGTISLNGTITPEIVSKLNWAAQNALVEVCGYGSKVTASTKLELSPRTHRAVDVKFWVLPRLGGGGDCAMTLVEAGAGGFVPPFPLTGPDRKPTFRNMMQNQLSLIMDTSILSDMYVRLWRVTCAVKPVWRTANMLSERSSNMACSNYALGWEVYYEATLTEPATAEGGSWVPGYSTGNSQNVVGQLADRCLVANSACFCASLNGCGWRQQADGAVQCQTIADGDGAAPVSCGACQNQAGCPPLCSSATFACSCATLPTSCMWESGECKPTSGGASDVPCDACAVQDKCQAARPRAVEFGPRTIFALPRTGDLSIITITFNTALGPLRAARGSVRIFCGTEGREPTRTSVTLLEYLVPGEGLSVDGADLKIESGLVAVAEAASCTLVAEDGVVTSMDGLPSQPVDFGAFIFKMKDSVPPTIQSFLPSAGSGSVNPGTETVTISFNERVMTTGDFSAALTLVDLFGEALADPISLSVDSVSGRILRLGVKGLLELGRSYEVTIPPGAIIDFGNQLFAGLPAGGYKFKVAGQFDEVVTVDALDTGPSILVIGGAIGASLLALSAVALISYRVYVVSREPPEVPPEDVEEANNGKSAPKIRFDDEALRVMQLEDLPDTPDNRKSYKFDDEDEETNRPTNQPPSTEVGQQLRKVAQEQRRHSIAAHMDLPRIPTNASHSSNHSSNHSGNHSGSHSGHSNRRASEPGGTKEEGKHHHHHKSSKVHPPAAEEDPGKRPKKEPPKLKVGHYLAPAWEG